VIATDITVPTNYDVRTNDIVIDAPAIVDLDQWSITTNDGNWSVEADKTLTFTPSASFGGGNISIEYTITDTQNRHDRANIIITYPIIVRAVSDTKNKTQIVATNINLVNNDTYPSLTDATIALNGQLQSAEGNWTLESDNSVSFAPDVSFGGGNVYMSYTLTDTTTGRSSTSYVLVNYPVIIKAQDDQLSPTDTTTPVTIDVLVNDTYTPKVTITFSNGQTTSSDFDGDWSVDNNNNVIFTPKGSLSTGTWVHAEYTITDQNGRASSASIYLTY